MQYVISNVRKDGSLTVRFRYWLNNKNKTVPANTLPKFFTEAEIIRYMPLLEAKYDTQRMEKERREYWHDKYYNFIGLREQYIEHAKEKAPNTWSAKIGYLDNYIFHFFLNEKRIVNLDLWKNHFMEFRQWLKTVESFRNKDKRLAPNTINHCILELNMFMEYMNKLGMCEMQPRCDVFAGAKEDSKKGLEYVFTDREADELYEFLLHEKNPVFADAFWVLLKTGMRISELRGIGPSNVKMGEIPQQSLNKLIIDSGLPPYKCFIYFNTQAENKSLNRDDNDRVTLAPLKTKRNTNPEHTRYVPIFDIKTFEIIKTYMKAAASIVNDGEYGEELDQYPFFYDSISSTTMNLAMEKYYLLNPHLQRKTCHDCRHTYATNLGGYDITGTLQEYICGHKKESAERYNHLKAQMLEKVKLQSKDTFSDWL